MRRMQSAFVSEEEVRAVVGWWRDHVGREGTADGDDGEASSASSEASSTSSEDALRLLRALATEVMAQADALVSAHIAFVRAGECIAVRRDHVERVLRRMEAEPGAVLDQWKVAGWIRSDGDNATVVMRTPWLSRARLVVVEWDAANPGVTRATAAEHGADGGVPPEGWRRAPPEAAADCGWGPAVLAGWTSARRSGHKTMAPVCSIGVTGRVFTRKALCSLTWRACCPLGVHQVFTSPPSRKPPSRRRSSLDGTRTYTRISYTSDFMLYLSHGQGAQPIQPRRGYASPGPCRPDRAVG